MLLGLSLGKSSLILLCAFVAFWMAQVVYLVLLCQWADRVTNGLSYFGRSLADRRRLKTRMARLTALSKPILWLLSRANHADLVRASISYKGVTGPRDSCGEEDYKAAASYRPGREDVFIATQMKCGTTWMQHLVYQILTRGTGDLVESGRALYAVSPWIESRKSVPMEDAPMIGQPPRRVIKTHLPTQLCPYDDSAHYIYVVRHPVSCFASAVDFILMNLGSFDVPLESLESWFCSSQMWWGTWPDHVSGWWRWSQEKSNVLFVRFEDMKADFGAVAKQVAEFLGVPDLDEAELEKIAYKCSFDYMQQNFEAFEMTVPTVLESNASPFVSGKLDRHRGVPTETRKNLLNWARESMDRKGVPLARLYPETAAEEPPARKS